MQTFHNHPHFSLIMKNFSSFSLSVYAHYAQQQNRISLLMLKYIYL
ncbi:protein of unknown function [Bartonella clarridgeiae 73]|uniref:Uncharacterized protein n=1 Tax=Bartonella clarridgeiae (strain CCUG 45776 / CIP 104772 / 73) TaxID=696125 RepID=E6YGG6_BARC7|nr:protein of unknown function [Bartonella clarridgeiae 73]